MATVATTDSCAMYCNRLNLRSISTCASAAAAKRKIQNQGRTRRRMSARLRLVRTQAIWSRSNRVIVPTGFSWEETAAKDAPAPPEKPADRRRNKLERYSLNISVVPRLPNLLSRDHFDPASLLRPLPKA